MQRLLLLLLLVFSSSSQAATVGVYYDAVGSLLGGAMGVEVDAGPKLTLGTYFSLNQQDEDDYLTTDDGNEDNRLRIGSGIGLRADYSFSSSAFESGLYSALFTSYYTASSEEHFWGHWNSDDGLRVRNTGGLLGYRLVQNSIYARFGAGVMNSQITKRTDSEERINLWLPAIDITLGVYL